MMAMGKPSICHLSKYNRRVMQKWDLDEPQILEVDHKNITEQLRDYIKVDPSVAGYEAFKWVNKFHDPRTVAQRFVEEVLE